MSSVIFYMQVWPLTQFFLFPFCKKIIDLPGGKINDPSLGKHYSLLFLPATPSSLSWTLEGLFELTRRPSRALDSSYALLPELLDFTLGPWIAGTLGPRLIVGAVPPTREPVGPSDPVLWPHKPWLASRRSGCGEAPHPQLRSRPD